MSIAIPSTLVQNGTGIPAVCAKHGEPAAVHKPVRFLSKAPGWSYLLILIGVLPFVIVNMLIRKEVQATAWPFCASCVKLHNTRLPVGIGLMLLWPLSFVAGSAAGDIGALFVLLGFVSLIVGLGLATRGTYRMLPWGFASRDGSTVDFPKAHPAFVAGAQAAYAQAAQQYAAWQASQQQQSPYQAPYSQ
jgi:hypothetical protein